MDVDTSKALQALASFLSAHAVTRQNRHQLSPVLTNHHQEPLSLFTKVLVQVLAYPKQGGRGPTTTWPAAWEGKGRPRNMCCMLCYISTQTQHAHRLNRSSLKYRQTFKHFTTINLSPRCAWSRTCTKGREAAKEQTGIGAYPEVKEGGYTAFPCCYLCLMDHKEHW